MTHLPLILIGEMPIAGLRFSAVLLPALGAALAIIVVHAVLVYATNKRRDRTKKRNFVGVSVYLAFLGLVVVLAASSFGSILQFGHMSEYALLAHIGSAGAFTFLLLAIAFLYLPWSNESDQVRGNRYWLSRWSAWALVVSSLAVAGTMFLSMLPVLGTSGLLQVAEVHRYAGLLVVISAAFHAYALTCTRLGWR